MPRYCFTVTYSFTGTSTIRANSKGEAARDLSKHCCLLAGPMHSTLPDTEVDWDFPIHPTTTEIEGSMGESEHIAPTVGEEDTECASMSACTSSPNIVASTGN